MRKKVYTSDFSKQFGENWYIFKGISIEDISMFYKNKNNRRIYQGIDDIDTIKLCDLRYKCKYKRLSSEKTSSDFIIITNHNEILNFSIGYIFNNTKNMKTILENNIFIGFSHDYDWKLICYFKDKNDYNSFINFISNHSELIITSNMNDFN